MSANPSLATPPATQTLLTFNKTLCAHEGVHQCDGELTWK